MEKDFEFMQRALALARRGAGLTSPNPMVGAVIVKDGSVVGEGYHRYDRLKHAESYAIEMAGERASGATLYCSLEPCCHYGRTPPCTDHVIEAGISRAVIAMRDPDRRVSGKGIEQLKDAGIIVEVGLCEDEAARLSEAYIKHVTTGVPFLHAVVLTGNVAWQPSSEFVDFVTAYDAMLISDDDAANRAIAEAFLNRQRHRLPVMVCAPDALSAVDGLIRSTGSLASVILEDESAALSESAQAAPESRLILTASSALASTSTEIIKIAPGFDSILNALSRLRVTSLLILPQAKGADETDIIKRLDRLTIISPRFEVSDKNKSLWVEMSERLGLEITESFINGETIETTGHIKKTD